MKPLVFSPDGRYLVIGTWRKQELYELASGRRWPVPSFGYGTEAPTFSRDGRFLFPEGLPHINPLVEHASPYYGYDLAELPPKRLELPAGELAIAPDGSRFATVQGKRFAGELLTVVLHDLPSRRKTGQLTMPGLAGAQFTPDGRWLALLTGRCETIPGLGYSSHTQEVQFVDPRTARVSCFTASRGPIWGDCHWKFSPDGKTLAFSYTTQSNDPQEQKSNPAENPITVELWEIEPHGTVQQALP